MTIIRSVAAGAAGLLALALMSGCTADSTPVRSATEMPATTAPASTPSPALTLHDGTVVTVTPGDALPQSVLDQIALDAAPGAAQARFTDEFAPMAGQRSLREVARSYGTALGRTVVLGFVDGYGNWGSISSGGDSGVTGIRGSNDKAVFVVAATDWAASNDAYLVMLD